MIKAPVAFKSGLTLGSDEFKEAFLRGCLVIDCVEIRFTQNDSETPRIYTTQGCIQASSVDGVSARLISSRAESEPYDPMAAFTKNEGITSGVLLPDSHYYSLYALDVVGNIWTHPSVDLRVEVSPDVVLLSFATDSIQSVSEATISRQYAHMVFKDELALPENVFKTVTVQQGGEVRSQSVGREGSKGQVAGMEVSYDKRKNTPGERYSEFVAIVPVGVSIAMNFQDRLLEALRFCTATMASPVMSETAFEGKRLIELSKARPLNNSGIVHPPISTSSPESAGDFYKLFECFFNYASANANGRDFAPISSKLGGLYTLKGVWLDTIVLLLGVAVEGILGERRFKDMVKQKTDVLSDIKTLLDMVKNAQVGESLKARVVGALDGMSSTSAADKLHTLIQVGALEEEDRLAWKRLRNKSAHGSFDVKPEKMQEVFDDVFRLTSLIHKLTFLLIGYSGKFSNRAPRGWRDDQFNASEYLKAIETKV